MKLAYIKELGYFDPTIVESIEVVVSECGGIVFHEVWFGRATNRACANSFDNNEDAMKLMHEIAEIVNQYDKDLKCQTT